MSIGQWSQTAANNATADPTINWQEGQAPSTVNDSARAMMAVLAVWFASAEWLNYALTPTYVSGTSFTVAGNQTTIYAVGRRVRTFNTGGTLYGTITASAYTTLTTVTVAMDSGSMDSGLSEVDVGMVTPGKSLMPGLVNIQVISATGTYAPSPGANKALVVGIASGGQSGGTPATGAGGFSASAGGASGAIGALWIASGLTSQAVTIGAPGSGAAAGAAGNAAAQSSFGALMVLPGGVGGAAGNQVGSQGGINTTAVTGSGTILFSSKGIAGGNNAGGQAAGAGGMCALGYGAGGNGFSVGPNQIAFSGTAGNYGAFIVFEFA
jgi:hypothetical protein